MSRQHAYNPFLAILFGGAMMTAGFAMIWFWGLPLVNKAKASESWPTARGTVVTSEVSRQSDEDGTTWRPEIAFNYRVAGSQYVSNRLNVGAKWSSSDSGWAHGVVNKYPVGLGVDVAYDPDDPGFGVLERGATSAAWIPVWIGGVIGGIGLLVAAWPAFVLMVAFFAVGSSSPRNGFHDVASERSMLGHRDLV